MGRSPAATLDPPVGVEASDEEAVRRELVRALAGKIEDSATRERWYPGFAATTDPQVVAEWQSLPYYRVRGVSSAQDWLEAALVRPPGVRLDLSDLGEWLEQAAKLEATEIEAAKADEGARPAARSALATEVRAAAAGTLSGAVVGAGAVLSALSLAATVPRPNPLLAFALLLGGAVIVATLVVAIRESHL